MRVIGSVAVPGFSTDGAKLARDALTSTTAVVGEADRLFDACAAAVDRRQDLVYDVEANTLHRLGCPHARGPKAMRRVAARSALESMWAPRMCECGPDVTLGLGFGDG